MPDLLDEVGENVSEFNESSLKAQLEVGKPKKPFEEDEGEVECEECGAPIPRARRKYGADLCIDCQKWADRVSMLRRNRGEE